MPRLLTHEENLACSGLKALRHILRMSAPEFARLLGMSPYKIVERDLKRTPWKPKEIAHIKERVAAHLAAGYEALDAFKF